MMHVEKDVEKFEKQFPKELRRTSTDKRSQIGVNMACMTCLCDRGKVGLGTRAATNEKRRAYYKTSAGI